MRWPVGLVLFAGAVTYYGVWIPRGYQLDLAVGAWAAAALTVGPLMGLCGAWTAARRDRPPLFAVAGPAALVLGEALFFVVNRRGWLWDFAAHPHRYTDLLVLLALIAVGLALPAWLVRPPVVSPPPTAWPWR